MKGTMNAIQRGLRATTMFVACLSCVVAAGQGWSVDQKNDIRKLFSELCRYAVWTTPMRISITASGKYLIAYSPADKPLYEIQLLPNGKFDWGGKPPPRVASRSPINSAARSAIFYLISSHGLSEDFGLMVSEIHDSRATRGPSRYWVIYTPIFYNPLRGDAVVPIGLDLYLELDKRFRIVSVQGGQ